MDKIYKYLHVGFSKTNYDALSKLAQQDYRTPSQYIRHIMLTHIKNSQIQQAKRTVQP